MMCNDSVVAHTLIAASDTSGLTWHISNFPFSEDAASLFPAMALAYARVPTKMAVAATATVTWNSAPSTCSIISVCAIPTDTALIQFDPADFSTNVGQNPTDTASQAKVTPLDQAGLADIGFGFFGSTLGAFAFDASGGGATFLAAKQGEPAVGQARSNVGLYYFASAGPTTTSVAGGAACKRWLGFGTLIGSPPPPIFRGRSIIIQ
jgi:hypothetical protein